MTVILSDLNRFSKFFHCQKACIIIQQNPPHLEHVAALPREVILFEFVTNYTLFQ